MVTRKGVPISSYDFSIRSGEPDVVKFAKTICQGLQKIDLPSWAYLCLHFCNSNDVYVYSKWHGTEVKILSSKNGGPSISTPTSSLKHIHWIQKEVIIVGFEWRIQQEEISEENTHRWHLLKSALSERLPNLNYVSDPTDGEDWPFRWQFTYPNDPSKLAILIEKLQEDTKERVDMIDSTVVALNVAGKIFGWDKTARGQSNPLEKGYE